MFLTCQISLISKKSKENKEENDTGEKDENEVGKIADQLDMTIDTSNDDKDNKDDDAGAKKKRIRIDSFAIIEAILSRGKTSSSLSSSSSSSSSSTGQNKNSNHSGNDTSKTAAPTPASAVAVAVAVPGDEEVYNTAMRPLQYDEIEELSKYKFKSNLSAGDMGNFSKSRIKRLVRICMCVVSCIVFITCQV